MTAPVADVCLLLEGTYPYVSGGVSNWVHNLIRSLPDMTFSAVCILPDSRREWPLKYDLPSNFIHHERLYLHEHGDIAQNSLRPRLPRLEKRLLDFHHRLAAGDTTGTNDIIEAFLPALAGRNAPSLHECMYGKAAWRMLLESYQQHAAEASFIDYFWTYRFTHLPLLKMLRYDIPKAKVYHAACTGYAGFLGVLAKMRHNRPLLLTEHGIYVKERKIEIAQADWIFSHAKKPTHIERDFGVFKKFWFSMFSMLGKITYDNCFKIITLYEGNRQSQIAGGADPEKTLVIPNGIRLEVFQNLKEEAAPAATGQTHFQVGFVGRVVPIKDVCTFIRACKIVSMRMPGRVSFLILGPTDEDPEYFKECTELVHVLQLSDVITFTGSVDVRQYYKTLDLIVLTSISEAQPLVLMEANCVGIPVVASDVGCCRDLLEGLPGADRQLGASGVITKVANPVETAEGIIRCLTDAPLRQSMIAAGRQRIATYYNENDLTEKYWSLYTAGIEQGNV